MKCATGGLFDSGSMCYSILYSVLVVQVMLKGMSVLIGGLLVVISRLPMTLCIGPGLLPEMKHVCLV